MKKLGVCIITKNPGNLLLSCLSSIYSWTDEIVLIDDYSTDGSIDNAKKKFNCKLYLHKYLGEGYQRIYGLEKMKSKWVLVLDADEIVTSELRIEILSAIKSNKISGYRVPIQSHYIKRPLKYGGENYSKLVLFKRKYGYATSNMIHSVYSVSNGKIKKLRNRILHFSYPSMQKMFRKFTSYAYRQAKDKITRGEKTSLKKIIFFGPHMFWARFVKDHGYLDGLFRLPLDFGHSYMEFLTYFLMLFVKPTEKKEMLIKRKYSDFIKKYSDYKKIQIESFCSFESKNTLWVKVQRRYITSKFKKLNRNLLIADIACGDGVGLQILNELGFSKTVGIDFNRKKLQIARKKGFSVIKADIHKLDILKNNFYDIIYSSHTLEHSYSPNKVIDQFIRKLKVGGKIFLVCPYPDTNYSNELVHGAKYELGLDILDNGETLIKTFTNKGLVLVSKEFDKHREPEIWLEFLKNK